MPDIGSLISQLAGLQNWTPQREQQFQQWYAQLAGKMGINPNPDDPLHAYDYRKAFAEGVQPNADQHWPSQFKALNHPNRFVGGMDTITGQQVGPSPEDFRY